jgi:hypothetical protein
MAGGHAYCSSCKLPVIWVDTVAGKKMPVERASEGNIAIRGRVALVNPPDIEREPIRYVSHFSVCPDAERHRKKKVSEREKAAIREVEKHRELLAQKASREAAEPQQGELFG